MSGAHGSPNASVRHLENYFVGLSLGPNMTSEAAVRGGIIVAVIVVGLSIYAALIAFDVDELLALAVTLILAMGLSIGLRSFALDRFVD